LICEEKSCTNEALINYKDLWMLCLSCKARWEKPSTKVLHLPNPSKKKDTSGGLEKAMQQGQVFMFGPDAM